VAHREAGLRSYDQTMPEEINRILTDTISDYIFTTCEDANRNLRKEGISKEKIYFVGNVIDHLSEEEKVKLLERIQKGPVKLTPFKRDKIESIVADFEAMNFIRRPIPEGFRRGLEEIVSM
jgi:UDP-N-acetylglucosamine 2-epimerase